VKSPNQKKLAVFRTRSCFPFFWFLFLLSSNPLCFLCHLMFLIHPPFYPLIPLLPPPHTHILCAGHEPCISFSCLQRKPSPSRNPTTYNTYIWMSRFHADTNRDSSHQTKGNDDALCLLLLLVVVCFEVGPFIHPSSTLLPCSSSSSTSLPSYSAPAPLASGSAVAGPPLSACLFLLRLGGGGMATSP